MEYIHCLWIHKFEDEPVVIVSEVDELTFEFRKVEMWRNGQFGWADKNGSSENTKLGIYAIGSLDEINSSSEFSAIEITKQDFENFWKLAKG